jgi:hypothetical protein
VGVDIRDRRLEENPFRVLKHFPFSDNAVFHSMLLATAGPARRHARFHGGVSGKRLSNSAISLSS